MRRNPLKVGRNPLKVGVKPLSQIKRYGIILVIYQIFNKKQL